MKTAIVIGATGLTGKHIVNFLLESDMYEKVVIFSRRKLQIDDPKLLTHLIDFDHIDEWSHLIQGDDLFSAMGTTLRQAGNKDAFFKVDYTYQANFIEKASANGVTRLFLISAPGVSHKSTVLYNRVKAKLDDFVKTLNFETLVFFRPSIIHGEREISRLGERVGETILNFASSWVPGMKKFKPISGEELGRAIVNSATSELSKGIHDIEWNKIFKLI